MLKIVCLKLTNETLQKKKPKCKKKCISSETNQNVSGPIFAAAQLKYLAHYISYNIWHITSPYSALSQTLFCTFGPIFSVHISGKIELPSDRRSVEKTNKPIFLTIERGFGDACPPNRPISNSQLQNVKSISSCHPLIITPRQCSSQM